MNLAVSSNFEVCKVEELYATNGGAPSDAFLKAAGILATVSAGAVGVATTIPVFLPVAAGITVFTGSLALKSAIIGGALKLVGK